MKWLIRIVLLSVLGSFSFAVWFLWPVLTAGQSQVKPERGVSALAAPKRDGCSVNAEFRIDLTGEGRVSPSGKPVAASVITARDGCSDLDRPLVAFNWWTLRGWWNSVLLTRYQMYAAQQVARKAKVTSVVFARRNPEIVLQPPGDGPASGARWKQPWVHQGATMPFYPSAKAIMHMVDASRDRYFEEVEIKHAAMGEDGYFGMQECLVNCAALLTPDREGIMEFLYPEIQGPVLIVHAAVARPEADAFLAAMAQSPDYAVQYAGWTVADAMIEAEDGTREPFLQKPLSQDLTVILSAKADRGGNLEAPLLKDTGYLAFSAKASAVAVLKN
jgi:hypothetical protein